MVPEMDLKCPPHPPNWKRLAQENGLLTRGPRSAFLGTRLVLAPHASRQLSGRMIWRHENTKNKGGVRGWQSLRTLREVTAPRRFRKEWKWLWARAARSRCPKYCSTSSNLTRDALIRKMNSETS